MTPTSLQHLSSANAALQRTGWDFSHQDLVPTETYPSGAPLSSGPSCVEIPQISFLSSLQQPHAAARGLK